jgi:dipeptidyl aminopeptidase/acylaminoacyl peptidase
VAVMARNQDLDVDRVIMTGHSAGGHLALWAAARGLLNAPFEQRPLVPVRAAVSFAGVTDLVSAATAAGDGHEAELRSAVIALLGGAPDAVFERYAETSPRHLVPISKPQLLVHGTLDDRVPIEQARAYVAAARQAGDPVRLVEVPTGDHGSVTRPDRSAWLDVVEFLAEVTSDR